MLYELEVLEARRIAELASDVQNVRDRLLEKVPESRLGEPPPARGEHNPIGTLDFDPLLTRSPEFAALRDAITTLPREIREKLWAVVQLGAGRMPAGAFAPALAEAAELSDPALDNGLLGEPDLQPSLSKGLHQLGAMAPKPG